MGSFAQRNDKNQEEYIMKKIVALLLALVMVFALAACGGNSDTPSTNTPNSGTPSTGTPGTETPGSDEPAGLINFDEDPYEVSIQFVGLFEQNTDVEAVEAALNAITLEKINCTVDIVPVFIGELPSTVSLGVAGDEKLDIVTVGLTYAMSSAVADETILPLDELLAERGQGALAATAHVAEAQKLNGVTYGLTGYTYAAMSGGFVYNKTMADQYGIKMWDGMTMEDLSAVGEALKAHGVYLTTFGNSSELNYKMFYGGDHFGSNAPYGSIMDPTSTTVINVFESQEIRDYFKTVKAWCDAGYLPSDQLTDTTRVQEYFQGQMIFGTSTNYTASQLASWTSSDFDVDIVSTSTVGISTASVQEFMLAIAANCERPDKAMDMLNLIYTDPEVANLLQYGIEGTDYVTVEGTENVITRAGTANADGNGYSSTFAHFGKASDLKVLAPLTDGFYDDADALEAAAEKAACFGYSFDASDFGAEAGAISAVLQEKLPMLNAGVVADVDKAVDELVAALDDAGINDVIAANQKQLDAYLGK